MTTRTFTAYTSAALVGAATSAWITLAHSEIHFVWAILIGAMAGWIVATVIQGMAKRGGER